MQSLSGTKEQWVDLYMHRVRWEMKPQEPLNPRWCFQIRAKSDMPTPPRLLLQHTRTWLGRKRRVLICKIRFGNSTPLLWMSDQQSKLYWDPLRDDRWNLSLWAWRGAAGDTWYVIRRWCHGRRWLPLPFSLPPPPPPPASLLLVCKMAALWAAHRELLSLPICVVSGAMILDSSHLNLHAI